MEMCLKCAQGNIELETVSECQHNVCHSCLCEHLNVTSTMISCPVENCTKFIDEDILKKCLANDELCLYNFLKSSNNGIKCLVKDCNSFSDGLLNTEHFICSRCEQPNCLRCKRLHVLEEECDTIKDYNQSEIEIRANDVLKTKIRTELNSLYKENYLLPNPKYFICSICDKFVLPRAGVVLRNCLHSFCRDCLKMSFSDIAYISQITCVFDGCQKVLDSSEILGVIDEDSFAKMMIKEASPRFFQCKNGDCFGMLDIISDVNVYNCIVCGKINCLKCFDIHEGIICEVFKKTNRYVSPQVQENAIKEKQYIKCIICTEVLIKNGGCSSMFCSNCGNSTCVFTGKKPGQHYTKFCYCNGISDCCFADSFCKCSTKNPCDVNCLFGCHPESL